MKVTIVIPAHNEEKRLARTLRHYIDYFSSQPFSTEILVVLNGCSDGTLALVQEFQRRSSMINFLNIADSGKGLAIAQGFAQAALQNNDYIGFVDADMATAPHYFCDLIKKIGQFDGIIASRYMKGATVAPPRPWIKYWGRRLVYDNLVYLLFFMNYKDFQCGAKLFTRETIVKIVPHLTVKQWAFDVELLYLAKKFGFKVKEIPTVWCDQDDSKLKIMRSGVRMLGSVVKLRIHHSPFGRFLSSK